MFWKPKKAESFANGFPFPFSFAFFVFAGLAGMLLWMEASKFYNAFRSRKWESTTCRITLSEVESRERNSGVQYRPSIAYRYSFRGTNYTSARIRLADWPWLKDYSSASETCAKYPVGGVNRCFVNPSAPDEAILDRGINTFPPIIIFPLVIWAIYERLALTLWWKNRRSRSRRGTRPHLVSDDIPGTKAGRAEAWLALGTGAGSVALLSAIWIVPLKKTVEARSWHSASCVVLRSEVRTQLHHQGQSFEADVLFSYRVNGVPYESSRLDLSSDMSMSYSAVKERLALYPAGSTNICFYNPANPREAVLRRSSSADFFFSVFGTALLAISGFVAFQSRVTRARGASPTGLPRIPARGRPRVVFSAKKEALLIFAGCLVGILASGFVGARLLTQVIRSIRDFTVELLPLLYFMVCTGGVAWCARKAWSAFDKLRFSTPRLELTPGLLVMGEPFTLGLEFQPASTRN